MWYLPPWNGGLCLDNVTVTPAADGRFPSPVFLGLPDGKVLSHVPSSSLGRIIKHMAAKYQLFLQFYSYIQCGRDGALLTIHNQVVTDRLVLRSACGAAEHDEAHLPLLVNRPIG